MEDTPVQIKMRIVFLKHGRQIYTLKQRTELLYDGYTIETGGEPFHFSMVKTLEGWSFSEDLTLPTWLLERESEIIAIFSITRPGPTHIEGYFN